MTEPEPLPAPELEVGRYGLRSFKFSIEPVYRYAYPELLNRFGWDDQLVRVWRAPAHVIPGDWVDGTCTAVCPNDRMTRVFGEAPHDPPGDNCHCGIYASLSYGDLLRQFRNEARHIVAVIAAEGATIIGDRGLRTAYARVVGYWVNPDRLMRDTASEQFTDAIAYSSPAELVEAYNLPLLPPTGVGEKPGPKFWA